MADLQRKINKLEADLESRDVAIAKLNARVEAMVRENEDMREWSAALAEREQRVQALEKKMEEWEKVREATGAQRLALRSEVQEVESSRRSLEVESAGANGAPSPSTSTLTINAAETSELISLREKHQSTLTELDSVSSKYRDALKEISDLAAQIAEARLNSESSSDVGSELGATNRLAPPSPVPGRRSLTRRETLDGGLTLSPPPKSLGLARVRR